MPDKFFHFLSLLFFLCTGYSSRGQLFSEYNFKFRTYTSTDGLVHNSVKKCMADSKGFLWIITENGLSRFDGYQFRNFQHINNDSNSLPANDLADIAIDKNNRIWLAYRFGLCYFDPGSQRFTTVVNKSEPVPASLIAYMPDIDKMMVLTNTSLFIYTIGTDQWKGTSLDNKFPNHPVCLMMDNRRNAWIGIDQGGYFIYDTRADTAHYIYQDEAGMVTSYTGYNKPTHIYQDGQGTIFLSTWNNAFIKLDKDGRIKKKNVFRVPVYAVSGLSNIYQGCTESKELTGDDILWVITETTGIALFSKKENRFVRSFRYQPELVNGIKTDFNWSIYTAPDGTIWISTWHGLCKVNRQAQQFQSAELPELNSSHYNCITGLMNDPEDPDKVWMSVDGSGLAQFSKKKQQLVNWYFHDLGEGGKSTYFMQQWLVYLQKDSLNTIWSASWSGLAKIKKGRVSFIMMPDQNGNYVYSKALYQDKKGNLWLFNRFLQEFNPYTEKYETWDIPPANNHDPTQNECFGVSEGLQGNMYIATTQGLFDFDLVHHRFRPIEFWKSWPDSTGWKETRALVAIGAILYIGTIRGIVAMDMNTLHCTLIGEKEQITKTDIASLHKDAFDKLWIYTGNAVFRYDPANQGIVKFTASDGIYNVSSDPAYFFEYNNELFLGYRAAYTRFNPALVNSNSNRPVPYITEIKAGGSYLPIFPDDYTGKPLSLDYKQSNISIDFTAIEYNNPEKISFSYMLDGFENNWIEAGNKRSISYTNLPGGDFDFTVKAYNSTGLSSEREAHFRIRIIPPFWRTGWFYLLILLAVSVVSILVSRWLQRKKQELNKINDRMTRVELASLRSQMNPHFIFNSLNSIHKYIWENKQEDASEYLTKFARLVRMILENSKEKEISLARELEGLQLYIELEHRRCNNKFDYSITVDPSINSSNIQIPSMIIQPYVENAIWHGLVQKEDNGHLSIQLIKDADQLTCIIEDNGIGRKKAAAIKEQKQVVHKSLGMDITQERLFLLSREGGIPASVQIIDVEEGPVTGTKIILHLPLNMLY